MGSEVRRRFDRVLLSVVEQCGHGDVERAQYGLQNVEMLPNSSMDMQVVEILEVGVRFVGTHKERGPEVQEYERFGFLWLRVQKSTGLAVSDSCDHPFAPP